MMQKLSLLQLAAQLQTILRAFRHSACNVKLLNPVPGPLPFHIARVLCTATKAGNAERLAVCLERSFCHVSRWPEGAWLLNLCCTLGRQLRLL